LKLDRRRFRSCDRGVVGPALQTFRLAPERAVRVNLWVDGRWPAFHPSRSEVPVRLFALPLGRRTAVPQASSLTAQSTLERQETCILRGDRWIVGFPRGQLGRASPCLDLSFRRRSTVRRRSGESQGAALNAAKLLRPHPAGGVAVVCRCPSGARIPCPEGSYLVDSASSHMLVSKIKPCMSKYKHSYCETANGSLNQLSFI
jgi:hypothetical protein